MKDITRLNVDCGVFWRGDRQVGGCFNAVISMKTGATGKQGKYAEVSVLKQSAETSQWWFFDDEPVTNFLAKFYRTRTDGAMPVVCRYEMKDFIVPQHGHGELMKTKLVLNF